MLPTVVIIRNAKPERRLFLIKALMLKTSMDVNLNKKQVSENKIHNAKKKLQ